MNLKDERAGGLVLPLLIVIAGGQKFLRLGFVW